MHRRKLLKKAKRLVIKIGSALLSRESGGVNTAFLSKLAREIAELHRQGREVILVSSGAIGAGMTVLKSKERPRTIPAKQALAAIGQPRLMQAYAAVFGRQGLIIAQVLLTAEDIHNRQRYSHARNALSAILKQGAIPIFNENDTVAVEEIQFGDNDVLSAHITNMAEADCLVVLTNVDGLYSRDPRYYPDAVLISKVDKVTREIESMAAAATNHLGTGGMVTKLQAAKMVTGMGEELVIANGRQKRVLPLILSGREIGTIFYPQGDKLGARKRWIAFALRKKGVLLLDAGAGTAVKKQGRSLLPSGILSVEGQFKQGDCVGLKDQAGREFARGLVNYASDEIGRLCGVKTQEIERILGYKSNDEIIHRNDLALLK
jgi:glutamate 5-kinase